MILWNRSPGLGITEDWFRPRLSRHQEQRVELRAGGDRRGAAKLCRLGEPERIATVRISSNLLTMPECSRAAGRLFTAEEDKVAGQRGDSRGATWVRRYGRIQMWSDGARAERRTFKSSVPASFSLPHAVVPTLGNAGRRTRDPVAQGLAAAQARSRETTTSWRSSPGAQAQQTWTPSPPGCGGSINFYPPNGLTFRVAAAGTVVGGVRRSPAIWWRGSRALIAPTYQPPVVAAAARREPAAGRRSARPARIVRQLLTEGTARSRRRARPPPRVLGGLMPHWREMRRA